ncbi:MAG: hypothetical protein HDT09_01550 [Bacteroidales bacterium]|nr:hypothetical protein [Bacteroidales bacterium]
MKKFLLSLMAAVILTACSNNNDNNTVIISNFATLDVISPNGAIFTVQNPGETQVTTLTASQAINADNFKAGTRVFVQYTLPDDATTSAKNCTLMAMYNTDGAGDMIQNATAESTKDWETIETQLSEVTITGSFINIIGQANCDYTKYSCKLYVDETTLNDEYPQLYLIFLNEGVNEQYLTFLGSWNFEHIRQLPTSKGMILNANNPGMQKITINF